MPRRARTRPPTQARWLLMRALQRRLHGSCRSLRRWRALGQFDHAMPCDLWVASTAKPRVREQKGERVKN